MEHVIKALEAEIKAKKAEVASLEAALAALQGKPKAKAKPRRKSTKRVTVEQAKKVFSALKMSGDALPVFSTGGLMKAFRRYKVECTTSKAKFQSKIYRWQSLGLLRNKGRDLWEVI